jgi:D-glycero-alpha-D-manno-heptose-7-phosphate kinase
VSEKWIENLVKAVGGLLMILTRSPLRISLAGGGTDLPGYYEKFGSFFMSAAINKYVYVSIHTPFEPRFMLKYSKYESCDQIDDIQHPIIRETLRSFPTPYPFVEIASMADIPAGTGLGSSGSFGTALIHAVAELRSVAMSKHEIASMACEIEINKLKESVGKQDQFIAAFGGINQFNINQSGIVEVNPVKMESAFEKVLESSLLLFYTGKSRSASRILMREDLKLRDNDPVLQQNLHEVQQMAYEIRDCLLSQDLEGFGRLMNDHWKKKIERNSLVTYPEINKAYDIAINAGAFGGKLVGAGGGGFLLLVTDKGNSVRQAMRETGLREVEFGFDSEGTTRIV